MMARLDGKLLYLTHWGSSLIFGVFEINWKTNVFSVRCSTILLFYCPDEEAHFLDRAYTVRDKIKIT